MFLCGDFSKGKKCCKFCKRFFLWGIGSGYCGHIKSDTMSWNKCKYFKRDSYMFTKDGVCKHPEELYT